MRYGHVHTVNLPYYNVVAFTNVSVLHDRVSIIICYCQNDLGNSEKEEIYDSLVLYHNYELAI